MWREDEGFLTFEWILLITLLVIGVMAGMIAVRDAIAAESINVAGAIVSLDSSYSVCSPISGGAGILTTCDGAACCFSGGVGSTWSRAVPTYGARRSDGIIRVPATCCQ